MTRYKRTTWAPTTESLPPPQPWQPRTSGKPPADGVAPMPEAPTDPGRYIVKLVGAYKLSIMDYFGRYAAERMEADHRAGVCFYRRVGDE